MLASPCLTRKDNDMAHAQVPTLALVGLVLALLAAPGAGSERPRIAFGQDISVAPYVSPSSPGMPGGGRKIGMAIDPHGMEIHPNGFGRPSAIGMEINPHGLGRPSAIGMEINPHGLGRPLAIGMEINPHGLGRPFPIGMG